MAKTCPRKRRGTGLARESVTWLNHFKVPYALLHMLSWLNNLETVSHERDLDMVELFSGCASLSNSFRERGAHVSAA